MVPPLDTFAVTNGRPRWLGCADTLANALAFAKSQGEGLYFVFSLQTGRKEFYKVGPDGSVEGADAHSVKEWFEKKPPVRTPAPEETSILIGDMSSLRFSVVATFLCAPARNTISFSSNSS